MDRKKGERNENQKKETPIKTKLKSFSISIHSFIKNNTFSSFNNLMPVSE
jgi:hypothetical protein